MLPRAQAPRRRCTYGIAYCRVTLNKSTISLRDTELVRQASSGTPCAVVLLQPPRKIPCGFAGHYFDQIANPQMRLPPNGAVLGARPDLEEPLNHQGHNGQLEPLRHHTDAWPERKQAAVPGSLTLGKKQCGISPVSQPARVAQRFPCAAGLV